MDAMTIGAQHSTLGNFGHEVFPFPRDGAANGKGFRGRVDMVEVKGGWMLSIPAHFASGFHFDGVDLLSAFQANRFLVGSHAVGTIGGGSLGGREAFRASGFLSPLHDVFVTLGPLAVAQRFASGLVAGFPFVNVLGFGLGHASTTANPANYSGADYWKFDVPEDSPEWEDFWSAFVEAIS